ncbi:helix-turn-helix transcriptional regulator [Jiangella alba]|uniref:AraC family transcriptional regulator, L-rhamnose operon transcriptional activator RhaR n=1 Tax=Jiangella alba TaxID=561176 RepID=A0A1H5KV93_9ACTN|nr:AraC family transcriptional regulator [Jiangella alba]SEE68001.1 AraC family transcriptional regulator, L-rhamnose operon transcriptional activator RhaR [Jiangella alba]
MITRYRRRETLPVVGPAIAAELMDGLGEVGPHSHEFIEIVVVESGRADHETRSSRRSVRRGYCAVLRPGEWHSWRHCHDLRVWNIYLGTEVLQSALSWLRDTPECSSLISPPAPGRVTERALAGPALASVIDWLSAVPPRHPSDGISSSAQRVGLLTAALGEIAAAPELDESAAGLRPAPHLPTSIASTLRLLEHDVAHPWTLGELADRTHLSPSHLSRLFSQATGMAPITYLARLRAEHVAADLINGDDPIAEIGGRYGWPDPNYLSRRFRHVFGISPRAYRRRYGQAASPRP